MNRFSKIIILIFSISILSAQSDQIDLTQVPGVFKTTQLALAEGQYTFNIINDGVDHEVGFVLVPKGKYKESDHIKEAYVKAPAATGSNSLSSVVNLTAGAYEYFCPLNPTPKYSLVVHDKVNKVSLKQSPGVFEQTMVALKAGAHQFEIHNVGVDHEVGFVLVPQGKYEAANHITAAYVSAPVATGSSSLTSVVDLAAGEYEYFCPLNPTPKYRLSVQDEVETVELEQRPGIFTKKKIELSAGAYQFNIANKNVDHEVGFVLVPKGKYTPQDHIKAAYVKAPVGQGKNSLTSVVELAAGEYEYFCPLNPTPKYSLTVTK